MLNHCIIKSMCKKVISLLHNRKCPLFCMTLQRLVVSTASVVVSGIITLQPGTVAQQFAETCCLAQPLAASCSLHRSLFCSLLQNMFGDSVSDDCVRVMLIFPHVSPLRV